MTTLRKLIDSFKNLKSDAVPQPPRPEFDPVIIEDNGSENYIVEEEDVCPPDEEVKNKPSKGNKTPKDKKKKPFSKDKKNNDGDPIIKAGMENITINTQATGAVAVILNSSGVHYGDSHVYNFGSVNNKQSEPSQHPEEYTIQKDNLITWVMEAKIKPEHEYIDYISKNLGKDWHSFFQTLGYTKGRIETIEIEEARNSLTPVTEARYKLLLDWARNDEDGTLGRLATHLWNVGERQIVKDLALIYNTNRKL